MAEKDSGRYCYEPYPPIGKQQNNGTSSAKNNEALKVSTTVEKNKKRRCCSCLGPKSSSFWAALLTNLGICTLLLAYTLLGKLIFFYYILISGSP